MSASRKRKWLIWPWLILPALLGGFWAYSYWSSKAARALTVSRQTTYITEPLNDDGTPNYVAYLDTEYAKGVTPANNAAPLLLRAFGPDGAVALFGHLPGKRQSEFLKRVGISRAALTAGPHYVGWEDYEMGRKLVASGAGADQHLNHKTYKGPQLYEVFGDFLAGKVHPDLDAWLAVNAQPLKLVRKAADRQRLYVPLVPDPKTNPPSLAALCIPVWKYRLVDAAAAMAIRAVVKMKHHDPNGAWDDVLAVHRLARLLNQGVGLVDEINAFWMEKAAAEAGIALATRGQTAPAKLRLILGRLKGLSPVGGTIDMFDHTVRLDTLDAAVRYYRTNGKHSVGFNETMMADASHPDWNKFFRRLNAGLNDETKALRKFRADKGQSSPDDYLTGPAADIFVGFQNSWDTMNRKLFNGQDEANTYREIEILAVALACYHAEKGAWPNDLADLAPSLVQTIPNDPFSNNPPIYMPHKDGYLLYSVGVNLADDSGRCNTQDPNASPKADDIAAEVKPVPKKEPLSR